MLKTSRRTLSSPRSWPRHSARALIRLWPVLAVALVAGFTLACGGTRPTTSVTRSVESNMAPPVSLEGYVEAPADIPLGRLSEARFASLTLSSSSGFRTCMVAQGQPEFQALASAVAASQPTDAILEQTGSSLIFVLKNKTLVSFALDRERLLLARMGRAYKPSAQFEHALSAIEEKLYE